MAHAGLFDAAGYRKTRVVRTSSPSGIAIIEAAASDRARLASEVAAPNAKSTRMTQQLRHGLLTILAAQKHCSFIR